MSITRVQQGLAAAFFGWLIPLTASAVQIFPECASSVGFGNCSTCDFLALFANISEIILQFVGIAVLVMVIIGGLMWIMSAGNPTLVQKGQAVLVGAVVGTLIVLGGYFIVNGVIASFVGDGDFTDVQLFDTNWAEFCGDTNPQAVVSQCTGKRDGTRCSDTSCTDNCGCLNESCQPLCIAVWPDSSPSCVADESACSFSNGGAGQCPSSAPFCCVDQSSSEASSELQEDIEEAIDEETSACQGSSEGDPCVDEGCEENCSCASDGGRCVPTCEVLFNTETTLGVCTEEDACNEAAGTNQGEGATYGCSSVEVCCEVNA